MPDLDIVGGVGVDVTPVIPDFNRKLRTAILPIADKVGQEAGRKIGEAMANNIAIAIPSGITQGGRAGTVAAGRQGDNAGGAFSRSLKTKLEIAFRAMPKLDIRLGDTGVDAELARIRAKLESLASKRIGVDIDAGFARAEVERLEKELERLGATHPNVAVRADTATARAALREISAEIDAVDAKSPTVRVDVDTSGASGALLNLSIQILALTAIPVGPVLAAGIGAVGSAAVVAGAGVGALALVAIPAIKGVSEALQAKSAADKDAAASAGKSAAAEANAAVQSQQRAIQIAGAQQTLAAARRTAAQSAVAAGRQIEQAERAVADAVRTAADQNRAAADAVRRAAEQRRDAIDGVRRAEESLSDANRDARQAEDDLTQARKDAAQQLKDLNDELTNGALDSREATLRVTEAQLELQAVLADPKATLLQQQQAQLSYDRAVERQKQQKADYADLQKSAADQRKAGVDGNEAVKTAAERLADAQRNLVDQSRAVADAQADVVKQTRAVAKAQADAARTQKDGAEDIADAQERVTEAVQSAADAQVTAAESVASAQRGLESARLSGTKAVAAAITKEDEYEKALSKLTPAARDLFDAIAGPSGLKVAFSAWSKELQPHVLPIFTRAVDGMKNSLPGLTPLVLGAAAGVTELQNRASASWKKPFWQDFKKDIAANAKPAIVGLGLAFGNVLKGMAGVVSAFMPHMDGISSTMQRITRRFANWAANLKGSPEFERFLKYVKTNAGPLAEFLGKIMRAILDVMIALGPAALLMFDIVGPLFEAISWLVTEVPELLLLLWGLYAINKLITISMAAFALAMGVYQIVMIGATIATSGWAVALNATGIVPIIRAIVLVIALLVAGVIYAYHNWDWFRNGIHWMISAIGTVATWLWETILQPVFSAIWTAIKWVGDVAVWLWEKAIKPSWDFIAAAAQFLLTLLVTIILLPIYLAFQALGAVAIWLWEKAIGPAFGWIADKATWLWEKVLGPVFGWIGEKAGWLYEKAIKPAFGEAKKTFDALAKAGSWLWEEVLGPIFGWIGDKAGWLYDKAIKPAFDNIMKAVDLVSDSFEGGRKAIKKAWDQVRDHAKGPVKFILETVYNGGIVPLWNKVAGITGADKIAPLNLKNFHTGGIMDGYSPGRDDRIIAVGGGEAIMRPEWTRAIGAERINAWNAAARSGGINGVQRAISAGMPAYKDGGVVGWFKDKANAVGDFISSAADYVSDPGAIFDAAKDYVKGKLSSLGNSEWIKSVSQLPLRALTSLKDSAIDMLGFGGGGGGQWIKPVNAPFGTPFGKAGSMWSSGRHTGLDFPASTGTAIKAVDGGRVSMATSGGPYGNHVMINHGGGLSSLYAHMSSMAAKAGAQLSQGARVGSVGSTGNSSGPHLHLEARRLGRAVDPMPFLSGGGFTAGAAGAAQSYAKSALGRYGWGPDQFGPLKKLWEGESNWNHLARNPSSGAYGIPQALPATKMASAGADWRTNFRTQVDWGLGYIKGRPDYGSPAAAYSKWQARSPHWYDEGGYLPTGLSLVANGTGRPEPVFTGTQWDDIRAAKSGGGTPNINVVNHVWVGDREITDIVDNRIEVYDADTGRALEAGRII
ncbi:aggregation-promoting factor C-terminal-like domain-containing protein [Streptomyces flavidovirens]